MENKELLELCEERARVWASSPLYDEKTRQAAAAMLAADDRTELVEAFYRTLEFCAARSTTSSALMSV